MKDPADGFDKHADKLTSSLDEITALLNQSINQSQINLGNNENMVTYINIFMSLLSLSIVLISNYFLGRYILNVIGGEPTLASNIVKDVAAGNLKNDVGMNSPRKSIMFHLRSMIDTLSIQMHDIHKVSKQIAVSSFQITEMSQDISNSSNVQRNKSKDVMIATELLKETFLPFSAKSFVLQVGNSFIGVNFKDMNIQQQKGIKSCLDFFNNSI
jgi:methyl-accepting chemotaxis protein